MHQPYTRSSAASSARHGPSQDCLTMFFASISAPLASNSSETDMCPAAHAMCSGVQLSYTRIPGQQLATFVACVSCHASHHCYECIPFHTLHPSNRTLGHHKTPATLHPSCHRLYQPYSTYAKVQPNTCKSRSAASSARHGPIASLPYLPLHPLPWLSTAWPLPIDHCNKPHAELCCCSVTYPKE